MAPVYDFRHVELDKIGRGKRIVKPPGGECSDIFSSNNSTPATTPRKANKSYMLSSSIFTPPDTPDCLSPTSPNSSNGKLLDSTVRLFGGESPNGETPRKVVDRQRSSIFEDEVHHVQKSTPVRRPQVNPITGAPAHEKGSTNGTPTNGVKSSGGITPNGINISNGGMPPNGINISNGGIPPNGINISNGGIPPNGTNISNGGIPPNGTNISNGHHSNGGTPNGHSNGYTNGHTSPDSPMNGSARFRNPPGGKSSGIF